MSEGYTEVIKILENSASEHNIPKKIVKEIYDLERGLINQTNRDNLNQLRKIIVDSMGDD